MSQDKNIESHEYTYQSKNIESHEYIYIYKNTESHEYTYQDKNTESHEYTYQNKNIESHKYVLGDLWATFYHDAWMISETLLEVNLFDEVKLFLDSPGRKKKM